MAEYGSLRSGDEEGTRGLQKDAGSAFLGIRKGERDTCRAGSGCQAGGGIWGEVKGRKCAVV